MCKPASMTRKGAAKLGLGRVAVMLAVGVVLGGLVHGAQGADAAPALPRLLELSSGQFDNLQQMPFVATAVAGDKRNVVEAMRLQVRPVDSMQLEGHWLYAQTDKVDPADPSEGKVYRQTLQQFFVKDGQILSRVWRFNDSTMKQKGSPSPEFLRQLDPRQISEALPEGCLTHWSARGDQFIGRIDPADCLIQSKYKDERRRLFAEEIVFPSGRWFREGAYGEDGSLAFGLEDGHYVRLARQRPTRP